MITNKLRTAKKDRDRRGSLTALIVLGVIVGATAGSALGSSIPAPSVDSLTPKSKPNDKWTGPGSGGGSTAPLVVAPPTTVVPAGSALGTDLKSVPAPSGDSFKTEGSYSPNDKWTPDGGGGSNAPPVVAPPTTVVKPAGRNSCANMAFDGVCDEPNHCAIGTDSFDCR